MKEERLQLIPQKYKRIVRNYYEEVYAKKFENLGKRDTFLEKYNLPKLNEELSRKPEQTNNSRRK